MGCLNLINVRPQHAVCAVSSQYLVAGQPEGHPKWLQNHCLIKCSHQMLSCAVTCERRLPFENGGFNRRGDGSSRSQASLATDTYSYMTLLTSLLVLLLHFALRTLAILEWTSMHAPASHGAHCTIPNVCLLHMDVYCVHTTCRRLTHAPVLCVTLDGLIHVVCMLASGLLVCLAFSLHSCASSLHSWYLDRERFLNLCI